MPLIAKSFSNLITFTRASTATYFAANGVLTTAATNEVRFDYDPSTYIGRGILIEEARTNLVLHNADLTNAAWSPTNITAAKTQTGINGSANSASLITATAGNGTILQAITSASAARFTSAYVKRITGTGTIEMTQDGGTNWSAITVTSGWTRVSIASATITNPSVGFRIVTSGDAIAVDGVQLENGAFATSVIPTTTATVTRAVDLASINTLSPWYNAAEGTIYAEGSFIDIGAGTAAVISSGTNARYAYRSSSGVLRAFDGTTVTSTTNATSANSVFKVATGYTQNTSLSICLNAGTVATAGTLATAFTSGTSLVLGNLVAANAINGYLRRITYYPRRLANADLQAITA